MLLGFSCKEAQKEDVLDKQAKTNTYVNPGQLIEAKQLLKIYNHKNIKLVDFRKEESYSKTHIDGALNISRTELEDSSYTYKGMMPKKETVEALFGQLGIANSDTIVVYDSKGSSDAARFWWILKNYGFESVRILNGGLTAWEELDGPTSIETKRLAEKAFRFPSNSSNNLLASKDELTEMISSNEDRIVIVDARTTDEYSGKKMKEGAAKAGRIPNSIHIDWAEAIEYKGTKKFKPFTELEKLYAKMGASKGDPIIVYCHTGARSAHTTFVLTELLGYENVKNYDGSWTEWSQFEELPFEKDSITTVNK